MKLAARRARTRPARRGEHVWVLSMEGAASAAVELFDSKASLVRFVAATLGVDSDPWPPAYYVEELARFEKSGTTLSLVGHGPVTYRAQKKVVRGLR